MPCSCLCGRSRLSRPANIGYTVQTISLSTDSAPFRKYQCAGHWHSYYKEQPERHIFRLWSYSTSLSLVIWRSLLLPLFFYMSLLYDIQKMSLRNDFWMNLFIMLRGKTDLLWVTCWLAHRVQPTNETSYGDVTKWTSTLFWWLSFGINGNLHRFNIVHTKDKYAISTNCSKY